MNKPLIALASAALLLAAAGCAPDSDSADSGTAGASPSATSSSPSSSGSPSADASAAPGGSASPSASASASPVVPGFPTNLVPIMPDSTPLATSFETSEKEFIASLTATTAATTEEVLAFYAAEFTAQGFTPTEAENQGTATLRQFIRSGGEEVANVTVVPRDKMATYTVSINTLPESAK